MEEKPRPLDVCCESSRVERPLGLLGKEPREPSNQRAGVSVTALEREVLRVMNGLRERAGGEGQRGGRGVGLRRSRGLEKGRGRTEGWGGGGFRESGGGGEARG